MQRQAFIAVATVCFLSVFQQVTVAVAQLDDSASGNPFGDFDNPFADASQRINRQERRQRQLDRFTERARTCAQHFGEHHGIGYRYLAGGGGDLDDVLSVLQTLDGDYRRTSPVFIARDLAGKRWRGRRKKESLVDYVSNVDKPESLVCGCVEPTVLDYARGYEVVAGHFAPFDWRSRKKFWLDYAQTFISPPVDLTVAQTWRKKIDAAGQRDKRLMRLSYLGAWMAARNREPLDFTLLSPLYKHEAADEERLGDMVAILSCYSLHDDDSGNPEFDTIYKLLMAQIEQHPAQLSRYADSNWFTHGLMTIDIFRVTIEPLGPPVLQSVVQHVSPTLFQRIAEKGAFDAAEVHSLFLKKQTTIDFENVPIKDAIIELTKQVALPLWLDQRLTSSQQPITLKKSGRWFDVFKSVLKHVGAKLVWLDKTVFWAGPSAGLKAARQIYADATARISNQRDHRSRFQERSSAAFSGEEVESVLSYLDEEYKLLSLSDGTEFKPKASIIPEGLPMYLTLELLARDLKADWFGSEDWLMFGTREQVAMLRSIVETGELTKLTENAAGPRQPSFLYEDGRNLYFRKTPLGDAAESLSYLSGVPFVCATQDARKPVSANLNGLDLATSLTAMLTQRNLDFVASADFAFVGGNGLCTRLIHLNESRKERCQSLPAKYHKKLKEFRLRGELKQLLVEIGKALGGAEMQCKGELRQYRVDMGIVSLDICTVLDLLAVDTRSIWKYQNGAVVFTALSERDVSQGQTRKSDAG